MALPVTATPFVVVEQSSGGSDIVAAGTFTVSYPTGYGAGHFTNGEDHKIVVKNGPTYTAPDDFTIAFAATATVTWKSSDTLPANSTLFVQLDRGGPSNPANLAADLAAANCIPLSVVQIDLGSPDVADPDGICTSQSDTGAHTLTMDGALVSGGVATFDVPRGVVVDSGGADTAVITVTGTDQYGRTMVESITLNGATAVNGKKAFKTVTSVTSSATIANGAFVGTTDVLGLPVYITEPTQVLIELEDGAVASAGTVVAGANANPTATTGDPFGTYDPNSAMDGDKGISLIAVIQDPAYRPATYGG